MPMNRRCGNLNIEYLSNLITSTMSIFVLCLCTHINTFQQVSIHVLQLSPQLLILPVFAVVQIYLHTRGNRINSLEI